MKKNLMHDWRTEVDRSTPSHKPATYPSGRRHEDSELRLVPWLHHWSKIDFLWHLNNLVLVPDWSGFDLCYLHTELLLACTFVTCSPTGIGVGYDMSQRTNVGAQQHGICSKLIFILLLIKSKKELIFYHGLMGYCKRSNLSQNHGANVMAQMNRSIYTQENNYVEPTLHTRNIGAGMLPS